MARATHPGPITGIAVTSTYFVSGGSRPPAGWGSLSASAAQRDSGGSLAPSEARGCVQGLDRRTGALRGRFFLDAAVRDVAMTPSGDLVAELGADAKLRLWERSSQTFVFTADAGASRSIGMSGDGRFVLTGGDEVRIWETGSERLLFSEATPGGTGALSHDGTRVATVTGREVRIYDTFGKARLQTVALEDTAIVYTLAFSPSGRYLAAGGDSVVFVIEVASGEVLHELRRHTGYVASIDFDPTGDRFVSVSQSAALVWDASSGDLVTRLNADAFQVNAVAFAPDGTVYTGSHDGTIRRWSVRTGEELSF